MVPIVAPTASKTAVTVTPCCRKISLILSDTGRALSLSVLFFEFAKERAPRLFLAKKVVKENFTAEPSSNVLNYDWQRRAEYFEDQKILLTD